MSMSERENNDRPSNFGLPCLQTNPLEMFVSCCFTVNKPGYRMAVLFDIVVAEVRRSDSTMQKNKLILEFATHVLSKGCVCVWLQHRKKSTHTLYCIFYRYIHMCIYIYTYIYIYLYIYI